MHPHIWQLVLYGSVNIITATISGISGGGAGFINTPLLIALGLPPAQAVATGKLGGLALALGSLNRLHSLRSTPKRQVIGIMLLALVVGLISPLFIKHLQGDAYRKLMGILILVLVPVMLRKRKFKQNRNISPRRKLLGYTSLAGALGLQGVFSGGLGTLVNATFVTLLGTTAMEANILKRYSQVILNTVIVASLLGSSLINWRFAVINLTTSLIGGMIGGHLAFKHGEGIVHNALIVLMIVSGLWLLFG